MAVATVAVAAGVALVGGQIQEVEAVEWVGWVIDS
jgi:hypothetical protein